MSDNNDWGFDERVTVDAKQYEASLARYTRPIKKHDCEHFGCNGRYAPADTHGYQELWDDFKLSQKQREDIFMEVQRARGRDNKERTLVRMFASAIEEDTYYVRLQSASTPTVQRYGQLEFEARGDCEEYYNYCIELFNFDKSLMVKDEQDFFADLAEVEGDFFSDLEKAQEGSFFDDLEEDSDWDTDEESW